MNKNVASAVTSEERNTAEPSDDSVASGDSDTRLAFVGCVTGLAVIVGDTARSPSVVDMHRAAGSDVSRCHSISPLGTVGKTICEASVCSRETTVSLGTSVTTAT